VTADII